MTTVFEQIQGHFVFTVPVHVCCAPSQLQLMFWTSEEIRE